MGNSTAELSGLSMAQLRELEVEAYYVECTEIDRDDLDGEFIRTPSDLAYWNERYARAVEQRERAKSERERVEGKLACDPELVTELAERLGKKPTVDQIKGEILNHEDFQEAKAAEIAAEGEKARCKGAVETLVTKRDMLISVGAHIREEMRQDLRIRDDDS